MSTQFLSKLSQNYIELLKDDEYYDITFEVGEDPNVKIFRAHMNILCYRSPYLRRVMASNKKDNNNTLSHIKLPNISPEIFPIILRYIYGGILSLDDKNALDIVKVLVTANALHLQELVDYLQKYLIENESGWVKQHFRFINKTSFQSDNLLVLQQFCIDLIANSPEKLFNSVDFTSLPEKSLVQIIKRDYLQMKEVEIWEHVLKWGLAKNPALIPDPDTWTDEDFKSMKITLQNCLPLIKFFDLSSVEFLEKVRPYEKLLNRQLYNELLRSYLDPNHKPNSNNLPRKFVDSKIVNIDIVSLISKWIDKVDAKTNTKELYLPYKFELLLRGSRDGFTPKKFHALCDYKQNTVTFIKVKGTDEILGGYNPIIWKSISSGKGDWGITNDSFIFSFKNKNNFFKDAVLSKIENANNAIYYGKNCGPYFGDDINVYTSRFTTANPETTDYNRVFCEKFYYERNIRNTEDDFSIEDYEVFQIIRK